MTQDDLRAQLEGLARQLSALNTGIEGIERRLSAVEQQTATDLWQWAANHWKTTMALTPLVSFVLAILVTGAWSLYGSTAVRFLQEELQEAAQENQILFQPNGLSFVRSPVEVGGQAEYVLVARRTPMGIGCEYEDMVPVFTDELGRSIVGRYESRGRQYGEEMTRTELGIDVPSNLISGRVVVVLQMVYDCDGTRITHETYPVAFELLPRAQTP